MARASVATCTAIVPFAAEGSAALLQGLADVRMTRERVVTFPADSAMGELRLRQRPGAALGACAWAGGVVLAAHAERRFEGRLRGLRVLELGCGTGVTAIALARLGARVTATDMLPDVLGLAAENVKLAGLPPSCCELLEFSWGGALPFQLRAPFDAVIGSEVTYNERGFEPLLASLLELSAERGDGQPPPAILLAETLRNKQQRRFWEMVGAHFVVREVASVPQHDGWNLHDARAPLRILELRPRWAPAPLAGPGAPASAQAAPRRVASVAEAADVLQADGVCVLCGAAGASSAADCAELLELILGPGLRCASEAAEEAPGGALRGVTGRAQVCSFTRNGSQPDYLALLCAGGRAEGEPRIFLVDGYAVLDALADSARDAWVPAALEVRPVEQGAGSPGPVVLRAPCGRRVLRCRLPLGDEQEGLAGEAVDSAQRVAADSDDPRLDAAMLAAYHAARSWGATPRPAVAP